MTASSPTSALLAFVLLLPLVPHAQPKELAFSGYTWTIRAGQGGPGPNTWDARNAWLDASNHLHLKIASREGQWSCAEVTTKDRLGFGRYEFQVVGRLGQFDDNVVLGLFNYPTRDVGPDATHEIDIEFARWGNARNPIGNFTVWPVEKGREQTSKAFPWDAGDDLSTHRFVWEAERITFQSLHGLRDDDVGERSRWAFEPEEPARRISQKPMPVHINLWLFQGRPPKDGREVEVVIGKFEFRPN